MILFRPLLLRVWSSPKSFLQRLELSLRTAGLESAFFSRLKGIPMHMKVGELKTYQITKEGKCKHRQAPNLIMSHCSEPFSSSPVLRLRLQHLNVAQTLSSSLLPSLLPLVFHPSSTQNSNRHRPGFLFLLWVAHISAYCNRSGFKKYSTSQERW